MNPFHDLNLQLQNIGARIELKSNELNVHQKNFLMAEADYDNAVAGETLRTKLTNPDLTQMELKAHVTESTYLKRIDTIRMESTYRKVQNELKALRDRLEALKEISYNLRKEATV